MVKGWTLERIREEASFCLGQIKEQLDRTSDNMPLWDGFKAGILLHANGKRFHNILGRWPRITEIRSGIPELEKAE